jgi:hypothetical protein
MINLSRTSPCHDSQPCHRGSSVDRGAQGSTIDKPPQIDIYWEITVRLFNLCCTERCSTSTTKAGGTGEKSTIVDGISRELTKDFPITNRLPDDLPALK